MAAPAGTRSRTTKHLAEQAAALTTQIRSMQEDAGELADQRREILTALVRRVGFSEAGRLTGMSKGRVHQLVGPQDT